MSGSQSSPPRYPMKTGTENRRDRAIVSPGSAIETTIMTVTNALDITRNRRVLTPETACANRGKSVGWAPYNGNQRSGHILESGRTIETIIRPTWARSETNGSKHGEGL